MTKESVFPREMRNFCSASQIVILKIILFIQFYFPFHHLKNEIKKKKKATRQITHVITLTCLDSLHAIRIPLYFVNTYNSDI